MSDKILRGVIQGNVIRLHGDAGISDGEVEIILRPLAEQKVKDGSGFLRTEGILADEVEWDSVMDEIQRSRKLERRPQWDEP